jgi:hypothetical protein
VIRRLSRSTCSYPSRTSWSIGKGIRISQVLQKCQEALEMFFWDSTHLSLHLVSRGCSCSHLPLQCKAVLSKLWTLWSYMKYSTQKSMQWHWSFLFCVSTTRVAHDTVLDWYQCHFQSHTCITDCPSSHTCGKYLHSSARKRTILGRVCIYRFASEGFCYQPCKLLEPYIQCVIKTDTGTMMIDKHSENKSKVIWW